MKKAKSCLTLLLGILAGVFLVGLFLAYRLGAFNKVEPVRDERGPYRIACLPHIGAYNRIAQKILKVQELLKDSADGLGDACGVYHDHPSEVPEERLRSHGGFVLKGDVPVGPPLEVLTVPRRPVVAARFEGHPALVAVKVYPVLAGWMAENGFRPAGPSVEFYRRGVVECEVPIRAAAE